MRINRITSELAGQKDGRGDTAYMIEVKNGL